MNGDTAFAGGTGADTDALAPLLRRLDGKPGFPALSESVAAINEITNSEDQNIDDLAAIIQRDFGLTSNILRVANSATYRAASGGGVTTVARAVSVLGFATLRDIALTVVLFSQMKDRAGAREIKEAFLRAQLAGVLAREAGKLFMPRQADEVYTSALFHSLGQILTLMYFPEEAQQIRELVNQQGVAEEDAVTQVLGLDFSRLGQGVARQWLFPMPLVSSLRSLPAGVVPRPQTPEDTLWVLSGFGNEACTALVAGAHPPSGKGLKQLRQRFAEIMHFSAPQLHTLVQKSLDDTKVFAGTLGVNLTQSSFVKQVTEWIDAGPDAEEREQAASPSASAREAAVATAEAISDNAQQVLSAGINKLTNTLVGDFVLNDILRLMMETLRQGMDFQRVLVCMKDGKSGFMVARLGCGKDADLVARKFRFPLEDDPNVFQLAVSNGVDIVIKDIADPKIANKVPPWYRATVSARTFILMPLMIKDQAVGLIYCDKQQANSIVIPERELSLMKSLRNQALLAIKQSMVK